MIRNLKAFRLAVVVVLAMSAVTAPAASALQGKLTSDGPVTLVGRETGPQTHEADGKTTIEAGYNAITGFGLRAECHESIGTGHKYGQTPHALISGGETTFTLTPHMNQANSNCRLNPGNFPITTDFNGCDYVAHIGETTGGVTGTYGSTADVVCPVGKEIAWTFFTNTTDEANSKPFCTAHIKPQTGLMGAHVTDTDNGYFDITGTLEGIHIVRTSSGTHPLLCPNSTTITAKFDLDLTVEGLDEAGARTPISLSE